MTTLSSALPKGEGNGLEHLSKMLIEDPTHVHAAVVLLNTKKITTDVDTGDQVPQVRILRIEPVDEEDRKALGQIMRRSLERRLGQTMLPIETEDEIVDTLANLTIDPETGEIKDDDGD